MRSKLPVFVLLLFLAMTLMVQFAPLASATMEATATTGETPGSENGLAVALGGAIAVYGFLGAILFLVMRKNKKKRARPKA